MLAFCAAPAAPAAAPGALAAWFAATTVDMAVLTRASAAALAASAAASLSCQSLTSFIQWIAFFSATRPSPCALPSSALNRLSALPTARASSAVAS